MSSARRSTPGDAMRGLTNTAIDALPVGAELKDDRVPGLCVRANQGGKSFLLYFRTKTGQVRRPKIGDTKQVSISDAREIARQMLAQVAAGQDPVAERQIARGEPTVSDLAARCEREIYHGEKRWQKEALQMFRRHIEPRLGALKVGQVKYDDVSRLAAVMRETPIAANRCIAVLSKMFNMAERWDWRPHGSNPCQHVERYKETSRRRYASEDEIAKLGALLRADAETRPREVAFIYLMLFSGARPSEIARATPDMVDESGVLRIKDGKTGIRDVFLPPQALAALARLPKDRKTLTGLCGVPRKYWAKVGLTGLWVRDLRRTFATVGLSNGVSAGIVGELFGHKSAQTTKVYAKLMEAPAHQAAASIASKMEQMLTGVRLEAAE